MKTKTEAFVEHRVKNLRKASSRFALFDTAHGVTRSLRIVVPYFVPYYIQEGQEGVKVFIIMLA